MSEFAVAAMGEDRPGIVAAFGDALLSAGASIEDSSMTILGGQFAMLLLVQGDLAVDALIGALTPIAERLGLILEVRATEHREVGEEHDDFVVAAYGPDRPGLVTALARVLADADANISNFGSRLSQSGVFAMWFNVALPAGCDVDSLTQRLRAAGSGLQLDVSVRQADTESL